MSVLISRDGQPILLAGLLKVVIELNGVHIEAAFDSCMDNLSLRSLAASDVIFIIIGGRHPPSVCQMLYEHH